MLVSFVGEGVDEGNQCRSAELWGGMSEFWIVCTLSLCSSPLLLGSSAPLLMMGQCAVEQGDEAGVFADVGQALNHRNRRNEVFH